ncbi:MAG: OadG family protein [Micropruina sp.]|uniref:OadG family protein n=1 Tax=Micropruina sp. TaxID=2737536 RepID=UPI0039E397B0
MENLPWGVYLTLAGMGTVLALLVILMLVLMAVGRLDRSRTPPARPATPVPEPEPVVLAPDGLTDEEVAAITIAVLTHVRVRRGQAAPAMREVQPGSQLFASRWVAAGRANQKRPWK